MPDDDQQHDQKARLKFNALAAESQEGRRDGLAQSQQNVSRAAQNLARSKKTADDAAQDLTRRKKHRDGANANRAKKRPA